MLKVGILNPAVNELLSRVRHTNTLVIADCGFPFWPQVETVDISLVRGIPSVLDALQAVLPNFNIGAAWMAQEFLHHNSADCASAVSGLLGAVQLRFEPHIEFKKRIPLVIGLIRTGGNLQFSNIILESA